MLFNRTVVVLLLLTAPGICARADVTVAQSVGATTLPSYNASTGCWDVTVYATNSSQSHVTIDTDGTADKVGEITILDDGNSSNNTIYLQIKNYSTSGRNSIQAINYIRNRDPETRLDLSIKIEGSVGSLASSAPIRVSSANDISIGGDLYNQIVAEGPSTFENYAIFKVDGDVFGGGLVNNYGGILRAEIGGSVEPFAGRVPTFWSLYKLVELTVGGDFEGRIGAYSGSYNDPLDVDKVIVGGSFSDAGNEMFLKSLGRLEVGGDLDAEMTMSANAAGGTVINVGGSFIEGDTNNQNFIRFPDGAIIEQSIINSKNVGGVWAGFIKVGTGPTAKVLNAIYNPVADQLGGGMIGVAPFNFHQRPSASPVGDSECVPYQGESKIVGFSEDFKEVTISHYGPVYCPGTGPHFRIEFNANTSPLWEDRTGLFRINTVGGATGTDAASAQRRVVIRNKAQAGNTTGFKGTGQWRIRPIAGKVKCADVSGNPDALYNSTEVAGDLNASTGTQYGVVHLRRAPGSPLWVPCAARPRWPDDRGPDRVGEHAV